MNQLSFKPGDDLVWPGALVIDGVENYEDYTLAAQIRRKEAGGVPGHAVLANAEIEWTDASSGALELRVPHSVTASWPHGSTLLVDVKVTHVDGTIMTTATAEFATLPRVTG